MLPEADVVVGHGSYHSLLMMMGAFDFSHKRDQF